MQSNIPSEADTAFEILLEEIECVADAYHKESAKALDSRDYDTARKMLDRAEQITSFRQKVDGIRREWRSLEVLSLQRPQKSKNGIPAQTTRLPRGTRTPEDAFYRPILLALENLGGTGVVSDILENVGAQMKDIFKDVDYHTLPSDSDEQRWRNTAKWARNTMVQDGRLKSDSKYGTWEITEKGRKFLRESQHHDRAKE